VSDRLVSSLMTRVEETLEAGLLWLAAAAIGEGRYADAPKDTSATAIAATATL
jgi:hypothetical protein